MTFSINYPYVPSPHLRTRSVSAICAWLKLNYRNLLGRELGHLGYLLQSS